MLPAEFPWEITLMAGCGMSGTAAGWISLRYKSLFIHGIYESNPDSGITGNFMFRDGIYFLVKSSQ